MENYILIDLQDGWGKITLNRPNNLNALHEAMLIELKSAFDKLESDPNCRAILLTGAGRGFCAGHDLESCRPDESGNRLDLAGLMERLYNPVIRQIRAMNKPVVAAVNGVAAGGGANLALSCDIVIAAKTAKFIQPFSNIGLIPDCGGTYFLPRLIGTARARAITFLAEAIEADQAEEWGMIWRTFEDAELMTQAEQLCQKLMKLPTEILGMTKRALEKSPNNSLTAQLDLECDFQREASNSSAHQEGLAAFFEKRAPEFYKQG